MHYNVDRKNGMHIKIGRKIMAGYILKIVLENTHPPVWRRVMIPEKINFADLHEVIQILFDWEGEHLHDFAAPSRRVSIGYDEDGWGTYDYTEEEVLIDHFWDSCKWIRYTYDFGDEWRHKIIYEKTDASYQGRSAVLIKAKGDNFCEDSGGVWNSQDNRTPFDPGKIKERLERRNIPERSGEILQIPESLSELTRQYFEQFLQKLDHVQKRKKAVSPMAKKSDAWRKHVQEQSHVFLELVPGVRTNKELLEDLSDQEVEDYCKYLQIFVQPSWGKERMIQEISMTFQSHPEYLLYVFFKEEYREFLTWSRRPMGTFCQKDCRSDMPLKAMAMGLMDAEFVQEKDGCRVKICFASDLESILKALQESEEVYRWLQSCSDKLESLILVYGLIEMDALYDMFCHIYKEKISQTDFRRFVYWHARFNDRIQTAFTADGQSYAAAVQMDLKKVLYNQSEYAKDLDYRNFSRQELKRRALDPVGEHDALPVLYDEFRYGMQLPDSVADQMMNYIFESIKNGKTITEILNNLALFDPLQEELSVVCALWATLATVMLELELPMLKGRSREEYASLKQISPWEVQMVSTAASKENEKDRHIFDFPVEIQEQIYLAGELDRPSLDAMWNYREKEKVCSEEFLFLLGEAYVTCGETKQAEKLIRLLEKSSKRGEKAAKLLQKDLEKGADVLDEIDDPFFWDAFQDEKPTVSQPYVRMTPKIGRNDPCPCGSGKKYKKCCGK